MPAITPAIAAELARGAEDAMNQAGAVITGNQGDYIQNAEPGSIYGKIQQETARQACRRYADDPSKFPGAAGVIAENICRPYLDDIGYGTPPTIEAPTRGGNCTGGVVISYQVRSRVSSRFNCGVFSEWENVTGVLPANTQPIGPVSGPVAIREFFDPNPNQNAGVAYAFTAQNGTFFINQGGTTGRPYWTECGESFEYRNVVITPVEGDIGDCPPVAPNIEPPGAPQVPGRPTERFNPGPGIDIDIRVDPIGPTFDIDFGTGPITIDPFRPPGGGDEPGGGGPGEPVNIPGDPTNGPGEPQGGGEGIGGGPGTPNEDGDIDFGAAPNGRTWVGAFVRLDGDPSLGDLATAPAMQRVFPRVVGNAALKHGTARSTAHRLTSEWTSIFRENDNLAVDGIQVSVLPSISYRVFPVSVETCPENTCSTEE